MKTTWLKIRCNFSGRVCEDIDECSIRPGLCGPNAQCLNTPGSHTCSCLAPFLGAPPGLSCGGGSSACAGVTCSAHAFCRAEGNEAYCVCEQGWTYDPKNLKAGCIDIDECKVANTCGENALCTNTPGGYLCQCQPGYTGNPQVRCKGKSFLVAKLLYKR